MYTNQRPTEEEAAQTLVSAQLCIVRGGEIQQLEYDSVLTWIKDGIVSTTTGIEAVLLFVFVGEGFLYQC